MPAPWAHAITWGPLRVLRLAKLGSLSGEGTRRPRGSPGERRPGCQPRRSSGTPAPAFQGLVGGRAPCHRLPGACGQQGAAVRASPGCSRVTETPAVRAPVRASLQPPRTLGQLPLQGPRVDGCLTPELSMGRAGAGAAAQPSGSRRLQPHLRVACRALSPEPRPWALRTGLGITAPLVPLNPLQAGIAQRPAGASGAIAHCSTFLVPAGRDRVP